MPPAVDGGNRATNPKREPKTLSPTDPSAAWTSRGGHKVMFGYRLNYLIVRGEASSRSVQIGRGASAVVVQSRCLLFHCNHLARQ
jgi:hypothetical protein